MDGSLPGSSVLGIFQARILEWVAMSPPGNLPHPGIEPGFTALHVDSLPTELPGKPLHVLLLLLSRVSRVRLCATPEMAARQAPPSLGFSRQEHWSGLPFPSPMRESEVAQSCPTLSDPMDCSLPDSSVHGISQARVLEWGAIAFSVTCARNS